MTKIKIELDPYVDGSFNYYPGHTLKGIVVLTTERSKTCRGFYIEVFGRAKSQWSEGSGDDSSSYFGEEVYIHSTTYLFGQFEGPKLELASGTHKYKFSCQLPLQLPYSLNVTNGKISYHIKAVLDIPLKIDKEEKLELKVLRYEDLNIYPELRTPLGCTETKSFMSLFNESNNALQITVSVPFTGFGINTYAPVTIVYDNRSSVDITGTKIKLIQTIILNSPLQSKTKTEDSVVKESVTEGVKAKSLKTIQTTLEIPEVMTSNEKFSEIVIVKYFIEVKAEASGMRKNLKVRLPITIGTLPLIFENLNEARRLVQPSAPVAEPNYCDEPPSYGETMKL